MAVPKTPATRHPASPPSEVKKLLPLLSGFILWPVSDPPVPFYTVKVYQESKLVGIAWPTTNFITTDELMLLNPPGEYSLVITGGSVNLTNIILYPFDINPPEQVSGLKIVP
jgi:hypothetical protein